MHKRRVAYDLDIEDEIKEQKMTIDDHKERMNKELCSKINTDIIKTGHSLSTDDIHTLVVKSDSKVEYGLKITSRKHQKL